MCSGVPRGGFGRSNTPLSVQVINYSLLIRLTELLVHLAQAVPGCWSSAAAAGVPGSSKSDSQCTRDRWHITSRGLRCAFQTATGLALLPRLLHIYRDIPVYISDVRRILTPKSS